MITLDEAIETTRINGYVCPMPNRWSELYDLLPDRTRIGSR